MYTQKGSYPLDVKHCNFVTLPYRFGLKALGHLMGAKSSGAAIAIVSLVLPLNV